MAVRRAIIIAAVLLATSTAGCLDPFRPVVDASIVDASEHDWIVTLDAPSSGGFFGPSVVETEYRFDPQNGPPFPGVMFVIGLRSSPRPDEAALLDRTRTIVEESLASEGVTVDARQELTGERTLDNGVGTQWFRLVGTSEAGSPLFASEEEVRVLGEAWYDGLSSTSVIVVALAQTTGTEAGPGGFLGQTVRDHTIWDELVGDAHGSIGGSLHESGFIANMVSHD